MCATYFDRVLRQTLPLNGKPRQGRRRERDDATLRFPPEPRVPSLASVTFVKFSVLVMHTYIHIHISSADILRRYPPPGDYPQTPGVSEPHFSPLAP
jgi:hypothetical protein